MTCVRIQHDVNSSSVKESVRGSSCLVQRSGQDYKIAKRSRGGKGRITLFTGPTG